MRDTPRRMLRRYRRSKDGMLCPAMSLRRNAAWRASKRWRREHR
jgi:hypothetical protein